MMKKSIRTCSHFFKPIIDVEKLVVSTAGFLSSVFPIDSSKTDPGAVLIELKNQESYLEKVDRVLKALLKPMMECYYPDKPKDEEAVLHHFNRLKIAYARALENRHARDRGVLLRIEKSFLEQFLKYSSIAEHTTKAVSLAIVLFFSKAKVLEKELKVIAHEAINVAEFIGALCGLVEEFTHSSHSETLERPSNMGMFEDKVKEIMQDGPKRNGYAYWWAFFTVITHFDILDKVAKKHEDGLYEAIGRRFSARAFCFWDGVGPLDYLDEHCSYRVELASGRVCGLNELFHTAPVEFPGKASLVVYDGKAAEHAIPVGKRVYCADALMASVGTRNTVSLEDIENRLTQREGWKRSKGVQKKITDSSIADAYVSLANMHEVEMISKFFHQYFFKPNEESPLHRKLYIKSWACWYSKPYYPSQFARTLAYLFAERLSCLVRVGKIKNYDALEDLRWRISAVTGDSTLCGIYEPPPPDPVAI